LPPSITDEINGMFEMRQKSLLTDKFRASVFQSVGLSPIITETDEIGTFLTYRGPTTPGTFLRSSSVATDTDSVCAAQEILNARETQTIGGLLLQMEMRAEDGDNEENFEGAETVPSQRVIYDVDDTEDDEDSDASDDDSDVSDDEEEVGARVFASRK
jgi:hypothetical protein